MKYLYKYSIIRFSPSPTRGERVNLGLLIGSDIAGDWAFEVVAQRSRANLIDDEEVFPAVAAEIESLQAVVQRYGVDSFRFSEETMPSEAWHRELFETHQSLLQFTETMPVIASSASEAIGLLWSTLIVEPAKLLRSALTKSMVARRYFDRLVHQVGTNHAKANTTLLAGPMKTTIDVAAHNGKALDLTQCWSFGVKDKSSVVDSVKAWGFSIERLRETGGLIVDKERRNQLVVPAEVRVSVVYYGGTSMNEELEEAFAVFKSSNVHATCLALDDSEDVDAHIKSISQELSEHEGESNFELRST